MWYTEGQHGPRVEMFRNVGPLPASHLPLLIGHRGSPLLLTYHPAYLSRLPSHPTVQIAAQVSFIRIATLGVFLCLRGYNLPICLNISRFHCVQKWYSEV